MTQEQTIESSREAPRLKGFYFLPGHELGTESPIIRLPILRGTPHGMALNDKREHPERREAALDTNEALFRTLGESKIKPLEGAGRKDTPSRPYFASTFLMLGTGREEPPHITVITREMVQESLNRSPYDAQKRAEVANGADPGTLGIRKDVETDIKTDAFITTEPGVWLAGAPADCPMGLMKVIDPKNPYQEKAVANGHFGEPEVNKGVVEATIKTLLEVTGAQAEQIVLGLTLGINPEHYRLEKKWVEAAEPTDEEKKAGKYNWRLNRKYWKDHIKEVTDEKTGIIYYEVDISGKVAAIALECGILPENIQIQAGELDSYALAERYEFPSHRKATELENDATNAEQTGDAKKAKALQEKAKKLEGRTKVAIAMSAA